MKKAILFAAFLLGVSPIIGQSADNVESATRFREFKNTPQIEKTVANQDIEFNYFRVLDNKSSAQLEELGGRWGWAKSSAQLEELGGRWGWAKSNVQLDELGGRWGWAKSGAQLEELGGRWGWAK